MSILEVGPTGNRPRAGFLCALSLLVMVTALAGTLGSFRRLLPGERVRPKGWTMSFAAPQQWTPAEFPSETGKTIAYVGPTYGGRRRLLLIHQTRARSDSPPEALAKACYMEFAFLGLGNPFVSPGSDAVSAPFGSLSGSRIANGQVAVWASVHAPYGYCVGLISDKPVDSEEMQVAQRVVDSAQIER